VKDRQTEERSVGVPGKAKQAEDIWGRWDWVEPSVWTERMLAALEEGVKGGKWFSLIDKVSAEANLRASFKKVKAKKGSAGVDRVTIDMFEERLEENIERLSRELIEGEYEPRAIRRVWISKAGSKEKRPLGIPTVRDRVVQGALRQVMEPIFEVEFAWESYGFRPDRGAKDALRRVTEWLEEGYTYVVDADLKSYYDMIPQGRLMERIAERVADGKVLELVKRYLSQKVMESAKSWTPERGTPQGAVLSPLLSNIYLNCLDHRMEEKGYRMVRYADDFVVLSENEKEARAVLEEVRRWVEQEGLELHPEKTQIVDAMKPGGFDFLGYHFERGYRWPRKRSMKKLKDTIRRKTKRTRGDSLQAIVTDINRTLVGWFEYYKHSHWTTFKPLDAWIRMRLRSILRKRRGGKGRGRGRDHNRWTNAYFTEQGLFSVCAAFAAHSQSSQR
jgi:RNA-directed DNA polymerase